MMRQYWIVLILLAGCMEVPSATSHAAGDSTEVLMPVADSILHRFRGSRTSGTAIYVADSTTALALSPAARRAGFTLLAAPTQVWCDDPLNAGRPVGIVLGLRLWRLENDRAEVHWAATCSMTPSAETTPGSVGESGIYEVVRRRGEWQVARSLVRFSH